MKIILVVWGPALGAASTLLPSAAFASDEVLSLEPIVVTGRQISDESSLETRHHLGLRDINNFDSGSADEIIRRLPSVHVPVNSRGEAIAFFRNAGERQVVVFYEGAAINVPWDNRLDLSLFPAALIGSVRSASGPLAPHYGVNALGALSLSPRNTSHVKATLGSGHSRESEVALAIGPLVVGGGYLRRRGESLSHDTDLLFSQPGDYLRTTTDRMLATVFARMSGTIGLHDLGLTAFHIWGNKGIAPEGHRTSGARYWRYPNVSHTLVVGSARSKLGDDIQLESTIWLQRFDQAISNYANIEYERITFQQIDRDETWGFRELVTHNIGRATLVGSFNLLDSTHRQRDVPFAAGRPPAAKPGAMFYRQRNGSIGGELKYKFSRKLRGEIGFGYDLVDYVRTGDKPGIKDAAGWTGRAGIVYEAGEGWLFRAAAGRKLRAPTLRERFGEAINRFLINPNLKPERIVTLEAGVEWRGKSGEFFVIPFRQNLKNTIDQRTVGSLRQRINLAGSNVWGVEAGGKWRVNNRLTVLGDTTWTRVRRNDPPANQINRIAEKPSLLASGRIEYEHPSGISSALEIEHAGRAYSADPAGKLVALKRSSSLKWCLAYEFEIRKRPLEVFLNLDNLADAFIEPQLGLPAPGRSLRVGVQITE